MGESFDTMPPQITSRDPSLIAWKVHQAVESLQDTAIDNIPAIRRSLRSLDRATKDLIELNTLNDSLEHPVSFPDYLMVDVQNIVARPYIPDEEAQQMLAGILDRLSPFLCLSPDQVEFFISLLLSVTPCIELQRVWLFILVHCSEAAWEALSNEYLGNLCETTQYAVDKVFPWLERLFFMLQRAIDDLSTCQWSMVNTKTANYAFSILWRSCTCLILKVVTCFYQAQANHSLGTDDATTCSARNAGSSNIFDWIQASLFHHMKQHEAWPRLYKQNLQTQGSVLIEMTGSFSHGMVEYAMDALDGALVAMQEECVNTTPSDGQQRLVRWLMQDAMHHIELALYVLQLTSEWNTSPDAAALIEKMLKQCSTAFIGNDENGAVARLLVQLTIQYLHVATKDRVRGDDGIFPDISLLVMVVLRATEACPKELLEEMTIWNVIDAELRKGNRKDLESAIQLILLSMSVGCLQVNNDDVKLALANCLLSLLRRSLTDNEHRGIGWSSYFHSHFASGI